MNKHLQRYIVVIKESLRALVISKTSINLDAVANVGMEEQDHTDFFIIIIILSFYRKSLIASFISIRVFSFAFKNYY